ncbi:Replication factor-A C terminal domain-containing protein [Forsythia ovata]|uniref:Replication factor-A C terminal domain-containing protein n=1 Tax=Forsythia ovata TaxID=205694 RepID=A0ABD1RKZ4_9LAMI
MAQTFSLVNEVNATKKNWALSVLVLRAYETSSREILMKDLHLNMFRLQLRVVDYTGSGAFLVWNHEAIDLLGKTVAELNAELLEHGNEKGIPTGFEKLEERQMLFMVQVRDENVRKKRDVFSGYSSNDEVTTPLKIGCEISDFNNAYEGGYVKRALICDFSTNADKKLRTVIKKEND